MATHNFKFDGPLAEQIPFWSVQRVEPSLWRSLWDNTREALFPKALPPLKLTSRPIPVKDVWQVSGYKKIGAMGSIVAHAVVLSTIFYVTIAAPRVVQVVKPRETVHLIAPSEEDLLPLPVSQRPVSGGGGGEHDRIEAPKGKLPKQSMEQVVPLKLSSATRAQRSFPSQPLWFLRKSS